MDELKFKFERATKLELFLGAVELLEKVAKQEEILKIIKEKIIAGNFVGNEAVEMINFVLLDKSEVRKADIPVIQDTPLDEDSHIITA